MRRALLAATTAVTLALASSGCGGGGGSHDGGSKTADATKSFQDQANAICKDTLAKLIDSTKGLEPKDLTQAQIKQVVDGMVTDLGAQRDKLKALKTPANLQSGLDTLLGSLQDAIDVAKAKGAKVVDPKTKLFEQVDADANAIGLKSCAF